MLFHPTGCWCSLVLERLAIGTNLHPSPSGPGLMERFDKLAVQLGTRPERIFLFSKTKAPTTALRKSPRDVVGAHSCLFFPFGLR